MKKWLSGTGALVAGTVVVAVVGALASTWGAVPQSSAPRVAVVNLTRVWGASQERTDLEEKLKVAQASAAANLKSQQDEIDQLKARIGLLAPGGAERKQAEEDLAMKTARAKISENSSRDEITTNFLKSWDTIFNDIEKAVTKVAAQDGYDLVFRDVETSEHSTSVAQFRAKEQRTLLYAAPSLDITDEVIAVLNRDYAASKE